MAKISQIRLIFAIQTADSDYFKINVMAGKRKNSANASRTKTITYMIGLENTVVDILKVDNLNRSI